MYIRLIRIARLITNSVQTLNERNTILLTIVKVALQLSLELKEIHNVVSNEKENH